MASDKDTAVLDESQDLSESELLGELAKIRIYLKPEPDCCSFCDHAVWATCPICGAAMCLDHWACYCDIQAASKWSN